MVDGCIYLCTPQDPLFHFLPILKKHTSTHSLPLDHLLDLLPSTLQQCTPSPLLQNLCTCTKSSHPTLIPDTFSLSHERVLDILLRKVDALIPVLGESLVAEYVDKPLAVVIGQERPDGWEGIRELGLRRCAMELLAQNLDEEFSMRLCATTEYPPPSLSSFLIHLLLPSVSVSDSALDYFKSCNSVWVPFGFGLRFASRVQDLFVFRSH